MQHLSLNDLFELSDAELENVKNEIVIRMEYAINRYEPWGDENNDRTFAVLGYLRNRLEKINSEKLAAKPAAKPVVKPQIMICDCGCVASCVSVMSTSCGSSCPDCYDRMSG